MKEFIQIAIGLSVLVWILVTKGRVTLRYIRKFRWPHVSANIQKAGVALVGGKFFASYFGYVFIVGGEKYAGLFAVIAPEDVGKKLQEKLAGRSIGIRYLPKNPNISILDEPRILQVMGFAGYRMSQDPELKARAPDVGIRSVVSK